MLCAWAIPGIGDLRHDDDVLAFLPPSHPDVVEFEAVAERFGMLQVALVGLRAEDGESLLVPERVEAVRKVARAVEQAPGVRLVLSFPDLPDAHVEGDTLVVEPLVPVGTAADELSRRVMGNTNAVGNLVSNDGKAAALLVYLLEQGGTPARAEHLEFIRTTVREQWDGDAYFGGGPFIEHEAATASRRDIERLSPLVVAVLAVASAILLGSVAGAVLNLLVTGLGVALVVGLHGRFDEPFTIVSSTTPVMMVALGGAFGMHIIAGYQRYAGSSYWRASQALRELWWPVVLSAATTAAAFFALVVMPQVPMKRFGIMAGCGVLMLLVLALLVLPSLLSLLPMKWLAPKPVRPLPLRRMPPLWLLGVMAVAGVVGGSRLQADPDTRSVFDENAEPMRADTFFNEQFGGSQFIQIAVEGELSEPTVLRTIRSIAEAVRKVEGVSDVRSLIDPVALLTEGFGGRRGIPETPGQARRVVSNLADQSPMAQLMTTDGAAALVHVKLAPLSSQRLVEVTEAVRAAVASVPAGPIAVGSVEVPEIRDAQRELVRARLSDLLERPISAEALDELLQAGAKGEAFLGEVEALRDRAFGTDELIEPLPPELYEAIDPATLVEPRGEALRAHLQTVLPALAERDPKGVPIVVEQLGRWIDEAQASRRVEGICKALEVPNAEPSPKPDEVDPTRAMFEEDGGFTPSGPCKEVALVISELDDTQWRVPPGIDAPASRELPLTVRVTGQPIIGRAFADSATESLQISTLVSLLALAVVLLFARTLVALVPATWTLAVTAGVVVVLGHPISIGTSMVSCIALGAGVDFAIHLAIAARRIGGPDAGRRAVDELGVVILITGLQLAVAFCVLVASSMPPLRQFGVGLAVGLMGAAAGAVWLTPRLIRVVPQKLSR